MLIGSPQRLCFFCFFPQARYKTGIEGKGALMCYTFILLMKTRKEATFDFANPSLFKKCLNLNLNALL